MSGSGGKSREKLSELEGEVSETARGNVGGDIRIRESRGKRARFREVVRPAGCAG